MNIKPYVVLTPETAANFAQQVVACSGCVRIFVHPSSYPLTSDQTGMRVKPLLLLKKITHQVLRKNVPILIIEDPCNLWILDMTLESRILGSQIYVIKSKYDDPEPIEGWQMYMDILSNAQVKKIVIAGCYLLEVDLSFDEYLKDIKIAGCIFGAAMKLSEKFCIAISHFVNPAPPTTYAKHSGKFCPKDHGL